MNLKEIVSNHPIESGTLALALLLEESYIGCGREVVCSVCESMHSLYTQFREVFYQASYYFH